ncbi:hypothetical protein FOZ61_000590, partial [Perkinsus olseni]
MSSSSTTGPPQSSENSGSAEAALRRSNRLLGILPLDEDAIRNGQRSAESDVENLPHDADINAPHDDPLNNLPAALETTTTESDDLNAFNDASSHPSQGNSREGQDTVLNPTDGDGEPPFDENEPHLGDQEQGRITDPSSMRLLQPKTATTRPGGTSASSTSNLPSWDEARGSNTQHRRTVSPSTAAPATINVVVSALREVTTALTDVSQRLVKLESRSEIKAIPKTVPVPTGLHTAIRTSQLTTTNQASIVPPNQATKSFTIAHDSSRVPQSVKPSPTSMASCVDSLNIDPNMDALTRAMITASRLKPTPPSELFCGSSGKKTVEVYLHEITSDFRYILSSNNMKIALLISSMTQNTVAHITSLYTAKYGAITSSGNVDADVFLPRLVEVLREAYTTSTAHMDARLSSSAPKLEPYAVESSSLQKHWDGFGVVFPLHFDNGPVTTYHLLPAKTSLNSTPLTATPSDGHPLPSAVIHNETEDTVQPSQPQLTFDLDNYITNYFTSIVSYTAVDGEQAHYQVADFDRCPGLTNTNTVDTLTVVPQPDGSYRHYHKLPWKSSNRPSVNLRGIQARTDAHLRRLSHEDFHQYNDCIQDLLHRGIIRPLKAGETPRWAMCHFGVKGHALSTTPLRPVFTGTQIGRHLHRPSGDVAINVINPLLLLRTSNIFHIEDLSKAFYSMYVWSHEELWLCFWHQQSWFCFEKCPMGIAPSTGFLANSIDTILTELQASHYPYTVPTITHVDDITQVFKTVQDREAVHDLNIKHFAKHHFYINADKRITNDSTRERALGVWIDDNGNLALYSIPPLGNYDPHVYDPILNKRPAPIDDSLDNNNSPSSSLTVQEAFSYVCACYDPLGLAAETTTRQRLLLRQALTSGLNNKDELPNELASQLRQCRRQLCNMMPTPRYVAPLLDPTGHPIYFACVDASSQAIGLTITARGADRVVAHSLLVPRSKALWTVVRLELQAIALAIPYIDQFVNTFKNGKTLPLIVICSDSLVNVQRLQSTRAPSDDLNNWDKTNINKTKQLLKQRGYLIRHLKGSANPADPISRGLPVQQRHDEKPKHYDSDYLRQWIDDFVDNYHATLEHCHAATTNTNNSPTSDANNDAANDNTANDDAANDDAANDDTPNDDAANDNAANDDSANDDTANDDAANNDIANNDSLQVDIVSLPQVGYDVNILKNDQREDPHISAIIDSLGNRQKLLNIRVQLKYYFLDSDGLLRYYPHHDRLPRPQRECPVVIPSSRAKPLWSRLHEAHNHPGSGTGLRRLQRLVIWHRMPRDVRRWTSQCIICLRSRRERQATNTINKFRVKSTKPLEVVNIDYTGPYHGTSGSPVAVVMVCAATNYVCARLVPDRKLSTLVHCLFLLFHEVGFPSILCCDRDSTILAATDQLASWGIVTATIPAHSVKLAWWERVHRQLHDHMRSYLLSQQEALQRNGNLSPPPPSFADTEKALASSVLAANETPRGPGGFGITPNMMIRSNGEDMLPRSLVYNSTNSAEATQYVKRLLITPINDKTVVQQLRGGMALSLRRYLQLVRLPHLKRHDGRVRYQVPIDHPASRLQPGDECYYWRPRAHKLSSCWLPATFIARPAGTNFAILQKPTGKRITEYFFN